MVTDFVNRATVLANIDVKRLTKILQKYNLWSYVGPDSTQSKIDFLNNIVFMSTKVLNNVLYEINNTITYLQQQTLKEKQQNKIIYRRLELEKRIKDYDIVINQLKNQEINFKTTLANTDSDKDIHTFEAFTQQWADVQEKIALLQNEKRQLVNQLFPHPNKFGLYY